MEQLPITFNPSNTTAHCRSCDRQLPRAELAERVDMGNQDIYDRCRFCGSVDIDVMSPEGVLHEESMSGISGIELCA